MTWGHLLGRPARIFLLALVLTFLVSLLLHREPNRLMEARVSRKAESIIEGAAFYGRHCTSCHGARGEGIGNLGPALNDRHLFTGRLQEVGWQLDLADYITMTTSNGRLMGTRPLYVGDGRSAVMAPWANQFGGPLREGDIQAITLFIMNWQPTALGTVTLPTIILPPPDLASAETLARGRTVFSDHCLRCHSFSTVAGGGTSGPDLAGIGLRATGRQPEMTAEDYLRESVVIPEAVVVEGYEEQETGEGCGAIISEEQLTAVVGFLLHEDH